MPIKYLIATVLFALVLYGGVEAWPLIAGPSLMIASPLDNAIIAGGIVDIRGRAEHAAILTINGAPVLHDQSGNFSATLTFPLGGTILTFVATDRFGRSVTATRSISVP